MDKAAGFGQSKSPEYSHCTSWRRAIAPSVVGLPGSGENRDGMWEDLHLCQDDTSGSREAGSHLELCMVGDEEEAERDWVSLP